ncbi:protein kinase domain-containing protein, cytoplasmic [Mytilus galloprovincialis]|uniref:Protein kinase domain-containing protein, cytoplasmic n=1 Tax=Mytilus galloprovincialis TaxID=29158 RepID=A0A8B6HG39_MYTGA|nr:protein kinase domain-containing protein, cytoplasmic [Mytilus galloprovincialis]
MEKPDLLELHSHKGHKRNILFFERDKTLPAMLTVRKYPISCANIDQIQIIETHTGSGRSKTSNVGIFNGSKVVIKRLSDIQNVIGYDTAHMYFMKDILMRDQIEHSNLIRLLGYCLRHLHREHQWWNHGDLTAVYEYGEKVTMEMLTSDMKSRLRHAMDIADLLLYLKHSPLGPLRWGDLKLEHVLMINNKIQIIDFDYFNNIEKGCSNIATEKFQECEFNLTCQKVNERNFQISECHSVDDCNIGICIGYNAKQNIYYANNILFRHLLEPDSFPKEVKFDILQLRKLLDKNRTDAENIIERLKYIHDTIHLTHKGTLNRDVLLDPH